MRFARRAAAVVLAIGLALMTVPAAQGQSPSTGGPPPRFFARLAGWNLIAVGDPRPAGTGNAVPLYALQAFGGSYEMLPPNAELLPGVGYWAYYSKDTTAPGGCRVVSPIPGGVGCPFAHPFLQMPAGQFILIGNPYEGTLTVTGADAVYTYDPRTGYKEANVIPPLQGAFVYSINGGTATLSVEP